MNVADLDVMDRGTTIHAPDDVLPTAPKWVASLDRGIGTLVEIPAALLVLAEIIVLFAGVVGRYLSKPIILVGRVVVHPLPVARSAGRGGGLPPRWG